jgi:hypothetical protein
LGGRLPTDAGADPVEVALAAGEDRDREDLRLLVGVQRADRCLDFVIKGGLGLGQALPLALGRGA